MTESADGSPLLDVGVDLPQYLDQLVLDESDDEDEPVLRWRDGRLVDTWREGYPYAERMPRADYEVMKRQPIEAPSSKPTSSGIGTRLESALGTPT